MDGIHSVWTAPFLSFIEDVDGDDDGDDDAAAEANVFEGVFIRIAIIKSVASI